MSRKFIIELNTIDENYECYAWEYRFKGVNTLHLQSIMEKMKKDIQDNLPDLNLQIMYGFEVLAECKMLGYSYEKKDLLIMWEYDPVFGEIWTYR